MEGTPMFKSLQNIQHAFALTRVCLIVVATVCLGVAVTSVVMAFRYAERQREKIYVLDGEQSLMLALSQDVNQNRMAEARAHIKRFHECFFTISPDKSAIEYTTSQALAMADNSAFDQYQRLKEDGFYDRIIAAGISCEVRIDSIEVDDSHYPYRAVCYGRTSIVRSSNITYRYLETTCELVNCTRSDNNPHGFLVEKWQITDNHDIQVINR